MHDGSAPPPDGLAAGPLVGDRLPLQATDQPLRGRTRRGDLVERRVLGSERGGGEHVDAAEHGSGIAKELRGDLRLVGKVGSDEVRFTHPDSMDRRPFRPD